MTDGHSCEHCDDDHDHDHVDGAAYARSRRPRLLSLVLLRGLILIAVAAVVVGFGPSVPQSVIAAGVGLAVWVLSTLAGVIGAAVAVRSLGQRRALMVGALTAAAVTPALIALSLPWHNASLWTALALGAGYLAGALSAESVRLLGVRTLLGADTREGEVARESAAMTPEQDRDFAHLLGTLALAVLVGIYATAINALPLLVLVLIPWHVAITALTRRGAVRRDLTPQPQRAAS